mgnify:CR=1 FL=1
MSKTKFYFQDVVNFEKLKETTVLGTLPHIWEFDSENEAREAVVKLDYVEYFPRRFTHWRPKHRSPYLILTEQKAV